jgi:hypothetical protein
MTGPGFSTTGSMSNSPAVTSPKSRPFPAIVVGGLIVGVLDLTYAILVYSPHHPILVPQAIACGVLGAKSFEGGAASAALGVVLHFTIALGAATVYFFASRWLKFLVERAVLCGLIYGGLVFFFMHLVVLPLSAAHPGPMRPLEFVWHWFGVGLPIALSVRHYSR